jgi:hypothetical protein
VNRVNKALSAVQLFNCKTILMIIFNFTIQKEENGVHSIFSNYKPAQVVGIFSGELSNIFIKDNNNNKNHF